MRRWMFEQDDDAEEPDCDLDGLGSYYDDMDNTDQDWVPPKDPSKAVLRMPKLDYIRTDLYTGFGIR
ncbi:hypothetical protein N7447_010156 [Penicillium robsamsonii]|uniref:uncharacterized protein n=1 Tax=Penicillium robsamsonii TaxID=1792511 RepID=UPI0025493DD9|nr:uncharacterized protein N7447_010156 [Penicillium robsamsonii]KAJ5813133.1 hypothetical protein N7447_010156 [Penicillium robsamsonii]